MKRWPARIIMVMLMVASLLAGVLGFSARARAAPLDWIQVNPDGFGDTNNRASYDMEVYDNHLYVGTYNQTTGTEVWRRNDDNSWSQVNTDGFGDAANTYTDSMAVYQGKLYIGTCNFTDGGEVWSYDGATWSLSTASGFGKVANLVIFGMALYNSKLYACTYNAWEGCEVWCYDGSTWSASATGGFGEPQNGYCYNLATYNGRLYAGTMNYTTGIQVWGFDGSTWVKASPDGFGDTNNLCHSMLEYNGRLYVGTYNQVNGTEVWGYDGSTWVQANTDGYGDPANYCSRSMTIFENRLYLGTQNAGGGEVWSYDGTTWEMANTNGFGDTDNKRCYALAPFNQRLYVATYNTTTGIEIWKSTGPTLSLEKTSSPSGAITRGQNITYTLLATNKGDGQATGCSMTDAIPPYTTYLEHSTTLNGTLIPDVGGTTPLATGIAVNSQVQAAGVISAGGAATVTFRVQVASDLPAGASITNTGMLNATGLPGEEASVVNPSASDLPSKWYFAEGSTQPGFDEYLLLSNMEDNDITVTITYMNDKGVERQFDHSLPAHSRRTVLANAEMPNEVGLASIIEGSSGFICERALYFNHNEINGGHQAIGSTAPTADLFFAEGFTGTSGSPFDEWILVLNPGTATANFRVTYMFPGGASETKDFQVSGRSRFNINVDNEVGEGREVSARIESDQPVVAERAMYFSYQGSYSGGHIGKASSETRNDWYLAEGYTGWSGSLFDEYILVANNNSEANPVQVTFMFPDGSTQAFNATAAAMSRLTIYADACVGEGKMISAHVHAMLPVVVERAMYFDYRLRWQGGHNCLGTASPKSTLYFAEGYTGNNGSQFETWLLIQNTSAEGKTAVVDYILMSGEVMQEEVALAPYSRTTVYANDVLGRQSLEFSIRVRSKDGSASLLAERAMYFDYMGSFGHARGGDDVAGY